MMKMIADKVPGFHSFFSAPRIVTRHLLVLVIYFALSGCAYETLPLAVDSRDPAFFEKLDGETRPSRVYFCWSDWGDDPLVKLIFIDSRGWKHTEKIPMTKWSRYYPDNALSNPVWITVLGTTDLYMTIKDTSPYELKVISESELGSKKVSGTLE